MHPSIVYSVHTAILSLGFLSWIITSTAAHLTKKTEFINWFDNVTADSPHMKGESITKHLFARAEMDRQLQYPVSIPYCRSQ